MLATALAYLASFIRTYVHEVSFGITAVSLMLFGPHINDSVRRLTRKFNWFIRYSVFVLLCSGGYTVLAQLIYRGVKQLLCTSTNSLVVLIASGLYLILAWVAKEHKAI